MQFILICLLQEQAKLAELQEKDPAAFPALPVGYFYIIQVICDVIAGDWGKKF